MAGGISEDDQWVIDDSFRCRTLAGFFGENWPIANFFAELGKFLLMFSAGLEVDVTLFRKAQTKSITFGLVTTMVPLLLGTAYGLTFGYSLIPAIVIGSLLTSHTLLSLSIVTRLDAIRLEPGLPRGALPRTAASSAEAIPRACCVRLPRQSVDASAHGGLKLVDLILQQRGRIVRVLQSRNEVVRGATHKTLDIRVLEYRLVELDDHRLDQREPPTVKT
jgi:hypothetical protein